MKILVTGAKGFIGKNMVAELKNLGYTDIYECDRQTTEAELDSYCKSCEFIFNFAGVNRPIDEIEFMQGNYDFLAKMIKMLKKHGNYCPILQSSSIQANNDNPYGRSKRAAEELLFEYARTTGGEVYIYRFPNMFGKWSKPNYNSVIATFCYNIARNIPIQIHNKDTEIKFIYIDDVIEECIRALRGEVVTQTDGFCEIEGGYKVSLGRVADLLYSFRESRSNIILPSIPRESFEKKLYSTYLSYLPENDFSYEVKMNIDERGSFTELFRTLESGQISVNISKPGIIKGNHWHHTKVEKFIVLKGKACFQFRKIGTDEIIEYHMSGEHIEVLDVPSGYTHNIINEGTEELITLIWANECFDKEKPDTYYEGV